jgi:hypothetical protein
MECAPVTGGSATVSQSPMVAQGNSVMIHTYICREPDAIVPMDNNNSKTGENWLGRKSVIGHIAHDTDPFGKGDKLRQGPNLHFLHHPEAMGLNCTFGTA